MQNEMASDHIFHILGILFLPLSTTFITFIHQPVTDLRQLRRTKRTRITMSFSTRCVAAKPSEWDGDLATLFNYTRHRTDHIDLDLTMDWKDKAIMGGTQLQMTATRMIKYVFLGRPHLETKKVVVDEPETSWSHGKRISAMSGKVDYRIERSLGEGSGPYLLDRMGIKS